jgi:serine/threonine protein kinase
LRINFNLRNIFVDNLGGLKIGDLGISKSVANITRSTSRFPGTANYMSPEIINEEKDYTNKIDVWALGCVVYELITQNKLFDARTEFAIKENIIRGTISFPTDDFDPELTQILKGYNKYIIYS